MDATQVKAGAQRISIISTAVYIPQNFETSEQISAASGIPQDVLERKMGIKRKPIPGEEDHSCAMGIYAAREAITKAGIDPLEIDLVIYIGEEHKEYPVWTAALKLQQEVGALNAWGFDVALRCCTTIMAIKVAKNMMLADEDIRTVLLAGGYRNSDLIDYENPRTRFMFNLSAGGGAMILRKEASSLTNEGEAFTCLGEVLASHVITDGSFSEDVIICAGGTKQPITPEAFARRQQYFDVPDPEAMKARLDDKSMQNFVAAIRESVKKSGYRTEDINYLAILHMKKSAHEYVLHELGLTEEQTVYLENYGHIGQFDQILSLELGLQQGKIQSGDLVVLVSAGVGYAWGATTIKWR
ncbi:3-oxoacyl-ACP synthase [Paenibacillus albiflavus]|uniref:3-oxoacyl-ACP synthase n=1 Tax=Paenibacillus albiflavus TaxID=2545760 RepID=A0A4R4ED61_9BACL|nr:3-oxoacyl-ACP synthase [Paenibacillus albiflavus]TCZ77133.1 3-oxoacyl-ACP synthase [Paenibacillus albiflavus]